MNNIFETDYFINELLIKHLSYKYLFLLYMSNYKIYSNKLTNKKLDKIYFTPKSYTILKFAVKLWKFDKIRCNKLYGKINNWNTLYITNMSFLFYDINNFNENLDDWILYNVTDFRYIIKSDKKCNQKLKYKNFSEIILHYL